VAYRNSQNQAQSNDGPSNDSWKATAFINVYLPRLDEKGEVVGKIKVGAIALKDSNKFQAALIKRIVGTTKGKGTDEVKAQIEASVVAMATKLQFDFQLADGSMSSEPTALGF